MIYEPHFKYRWNSRAIGVRSFTDLGLNYLMLLEKYFVIEISELILVEYKAPSLTSAPAKRSQHLKATYCNIVERNMLGAYGHPAATCWVLLALYSEISR